MNISPHPDLSPQEMARYSRHILLDELGVAGQERLKRSKVLIVGAGGLGSPAALYLAAAGVGAMGIADFDKVELHNLQRQLLHGASDVDRPKTESAKESLQEVNPHVELELHEQGISIDNALELFARYDIIVDGTDNFATRYLNNDAAYLAGKPLVYGSIFKFEGQASFFHASEGGPCYRCLFPEPPPPGSVPNCGEAGVMGALCGIIGSIQAMETIKHLAGIGESLSGRLLCMDTLNMRFRSINLKKDNACPLCSRNARITNLVAENYEASCETAPTPEQQALNDEAEGYPIEVDTRQAKRLLDGKGATLIDVREAFELGICRVDKSLHVPIGQIPERIADLPKDKELLVLCHHGGRSKQVVRFLRSNGFDNAINVQGGIDAWALNIDPSLQRY